MKTARLILACGLAAMTAPAAEELRPSTLNIPGIPTPLEEYGLSIGDVTVSRVINPLGQLRAGSPVMLNRHLTRVTNPWAELSPGTAIILTGKKAVVRQILPATPPAGIGGALSVEIVVEEIEGARHTLKWEQQLNSLNRAEGAEARQASVALVQEQLRAGSHLILNNQRVVVTDRTLTNELDSGLPRDLVLNVHHQSVTTGKGTLTGRPSNSEAISDPAWNFTNAQNTPLPNDTVQLVTWVQRGMDGDEDNIPPVTILHRAYGVLRTLELTNEKEVLLTAGFKLGVKDHMHTHMQRIPWKQQVDERGEVLWMMDLTGINSNLTELYRVNDTNIKFTVTPDSLLAANRKAAAILKEQNNFGATRGNVDAATLTNYLSRLEEIVKSDASESIKLDVRRRAVISLAGHYEHMAESFKAFAGEQLARADISEDHAKKLERRHWYNHQHITVLTQALRAIDPTAVEPTETLTINAPALWTAHEQWPEWASDFHVSDLYSLHSISQMEKELKNFKNKYTNVTPDRIAEIKLAINTHRRRGAVLPALAHDLRVKAMNHRAQADKLQLNIIQNYSRALQLWTEYVVRTEGLTRDEQRLAKPGIPGNLRPPDPLIPEIFLRQAWIYRQIGRPDLATDKTQDVLKAAVQQKIDNLTRYGRIFLVARSQIADTLSESARTVEDYNDANGKYENMLNSKQKEFESKEIELKLLRGFHQANKRIQERITMLQLKLKRGPSDQEEQENWKTALGSMKESNKELWANTLGKRLDAVTLESRPSNNIELPASYKVNINRILNDIKNLQQSRRDNWKKMSQHAEDFIERTGADDQDISYYQTGEVRYYQIIANKALGKDQHVQHEMEVLLNNESTPEEQREAWAATRVRVVIDIANMLYTNGKDLEARAEQLKSSSGTPVMVTVRGVDGTETEVPNWKPLMDSAQACYRGAKVYYQWALQHDQTYRSQILLRQQIAFCHERLGEYPQALETHEFVTRLAQMHPNEIKNNSTLRLTRILSELRKKNLERLLDQKNRTQPNN